jgi:Protein of unknown function (DUF1264)
VSGRWHIVLHGPSSCSVALHHAVCCTVNVGVHVSIRVRRADSDKSNARLIGIEYIISRRLFEGLPADEKKYWHSHSHEVGGLPAADRLTSAAVAVSSLLFCGTAVDPRQVSPRPSEGSTAHALICRQLVSSTPSSSNVHRDVGVSPCPVLCCGCTCR